MPPLALPAHDPALAVCPIAEAELRHRLFVVTRDGPHSRFGRLFLAAVAAIAAGLPSDREEPG
ncbi:hypothetical protein GCM10010399_07090 [Dactylosporangium fulvum]|uniref:LysR substrate-binding domain-containing protein n=1 Tax=Dactylosporangium fulvum TaxID=53359 RepID=A0ABY5WC68_9ACTN|nr:hypothetical protein [Dactylosporangium fulvum]UWP86639.1 hypothetical protein Dfulv_21330 [Dactylosporangium fulvum]